jgi:hypothetical protein
MRRRPLRPKYRLGSSLVGVIPHWCLGADNRIGDEAVLVAVEALECIEHRGFDGVGVMRVAWHLSGAGSA